MLVVATVFVWLACFVIVAWIGAIFFVIALEIWCALFGAPEWKKQWDEESKRQAAWVAGTYRLKRRLREALFEGRADDVRRLDDALRARLGYPPREPERPSKRTRSGA